MKEIGVSDFWDMVVEKYCDTKEKDLLSELEDEQFDELASEFKMSVINLRDWLKRAKSNLGDTKDESN